MQRRIILAATALAAALIVPTLASAADNQAGIGGAPSIVGQVGGSTPTGQAGGPEPTESAIVCGPIKKSKTPKDDTAHEKKSPTLPKSDAGDPADDEEASLEDELREQQELMDRLTDLLNQMQQRHNDAIRSATRP